MTTLSVKNSSFCPKFAVDKVKEFFTSIGGTVSDIDEDLSFSVTLLGQTFVVQYSGGYTDDVCIPYPSYEFLRRVITCAESLNIHVNQYTDYVGLGWLPHLKFVHGVR